MLDEVIFEPGNLAIMDTPLALTPRVSVHIRGYRAEGYLIVDCPLWEGRAPHFETGTECILRLMKNGRVYGFKSHVIKQISIPFPLLFLSFPEKVESAEIRKGQAFHVMLDVCFAKGPLHGKLPGAPQGAILILTERGGMMEIKEPVEVGGSLFVSFDLPEHGLVTDLEADVQSCRPKAGRFWVEFVFDDQQQPGYLGLRKYLHYLQSRQIDDALLRSSTLPGE